MKYLAFALAAAAAQFVSAQTYTPFGTGISQGCV
jgi:hypothetical protein